MESRSEGYYFRAERPSFVHKPRDHRKLLDTRTHHDMVTMAGILSGPQSKKRKYRSTEEPDTTHSVSQKKKEKRHKATAQSAVPPSEDALSSQKRKLKSPKDKGKSRALDLPSEFRAINASLVLSIPPVFASDLRAGVEEMLDSMIMR